MNNQEINHRIMRKLFIESHIYGVKIFILEALAALWGVAMEGMGILAKASSPHSPSWPYGPGKGMRANIQKLCQALVVSDF